jgi:hypothetical protein
MVVAQTILTRTPTAPLMDHAVVLLVFADRDLG